MTDSHNEIAVVGAGIGGLSLALALCRAGKRVSVYEQAPELAEVGAGISLSPNAVKGLRYLGIGAALERVADEPRYQRTRHYQTGKTLVEFDRANTRRDLGAPYLQMHRADLHDLLRNALNEIAPDAVQLGQQLKDVQFDDQRYRLKFANGSRVLADLLVGADGLRSIVRERIFAESAPEFSGFVAWRGLPAMESLQRATLLDGSSVFIAPDRIFVRYPIRHGRIQNFVAFSRTTEWAEEGWSQTGRSADLREHGPGRGRRDPVRGGPGLHGDGLRHPLQRHARRLHRK